MLVFATDLADYTSAPDPIDLDISMDIQRNVRDIVLNMPVIPMWRITPKDHLYLLDLRAVNEYCYSAVGGDLLARYQKSVLKKIYGVVTADHPLGFVLFRSRSVGLKKKLPPLMIYGLEKYAGNKVSRFPIRVGTEEMVKVFNRYSDLRVITGRALNQRLIDRNCSLTVSFPDVKYFLPERIYSKLFRTIKGKTVEDVNTVLDDNIDNLFINKVLKDLNALDRKEYIDDVSHDDKLSDLFEILLSVDLHPNYLEECLLYFIRIDSASNTYSFRHFVAEHFRDTEYRLAFESLMSAEDKSIKILNRRISMFLDHIGLFSNSLRRNINIDRMTLISEIIDNRKINEPEDNFITYFSKLRDHGMASTTISPYDLLWKK